MILRYDTNAVYIDATDGELNYFMHQMGLDGRSVDTLSQADINALAESICGEVFYYLGEDAPIIDYISKEWDGEELVVEILRTDTGVQLRVCPFSEYKGPNPNLFGANSKLLDDSYVRQLDNITKGEKNYMDLKKKLQNPNMKSFLDEAITDEFVESAIKHYLEIVYNSLPDADIEVASTNLIDSDLCHAYVARGLEQAISKDEKVNISKVTTKLLTEFKNKVKEVYKNMRIEVFYKVRCLDDAVKAMVYVSEGCILKVKDNYYIVTFKDNILLSEFGTKVESFCYSDETILCRIKNGNFDIKIKKIEEKK